MCVVVENESNFLSVVHLSLNLMQSKMKAMVYIKSQITLESFSKNTFIQKLETLLYNKVHTIIYFLLSVMNFDKLQN